MKIWNFRIFWPTSSSGVQNRGILNLYFVYLTVFWVSELVFRVSEPILLVSELISLVLGVWTYTLGVWTYIACVGCLNLYFGHQRTKHSEDLWIWKYWRTKHSGMTCESGNTEGPGILVWRVNLEILKDWNLWTSGPFGPWAWNAWAPRPFGPGLVPC